MKINDLRQPRLIEPYAGCLIRTEQDDFLVIKESQHVYRLLDVRRMKIVDDAIFGTIGALVQYTIQHHRSIRDIVSASDIQLTLGNGLINKTEGTE